MLRSVAVPDRAQLIETNRLERTHLAPAVMGKLTVAVVGVGALGDALVRLLGLAGAGRVLLVDPDLAEPSNLTRSLFLRSPDALGRNKAEAVAASARVLFPETAFEVHPVEIADLGLQHLAACDLLFGCLDSESARLELAYLAARIDRPVADAGLASPGAGYGRVSIFPSRKTACFGCGLRHSRRAELLQTFDAAPHGCTSEADDPIRSSTPTQAALISALQLDLGMTLRRADEASATEIGAGAERSRHTLPRAELCPFHEDPGPLIAPPSDDAKFGEIMEAAQADELQLDFPIALEARCDACEHPAQTPARAARIQKTTCIACGRKAVRATRVLRTVDARHADLRPADLGLPARHLYTGIAR